MKVQDPWQHHNPSARIGLLAAALTFACSLAAQPVLGVTSGPGVSTGRVLLFSALVAAASGLVTGWVVHGQLRRVGRLLKVSEAWLRGNLAPQAPATRHDDLGMLGQQLNQLVEHLEEDEEDLERLHESNARLTDQVRALAVVEERNRLARELHDSVKQHLFSLAMTASAVRMHHQMQVQSGEAVDPDLLEMIGEIERASQTAQQETTRLIEDLRPAPLQERGLVDALNDFTLIFGAQQHLLVYLDVQCTDQWLPPVTAEALYRVAQEALHNVARHAQATRVDVGLSCTEGRVTLTIEDNGVGFDTSRTRKGLGISSMQERLIGNGGRLTVESHPGGGTTVRAEIDVTARPADDDARSVADQTVQAVTTTADRRSHGAAKSARSQDASEATVQLEMPRPKGWAWLGERLVIPVGQVWPWLPVDEARYLRQPVVKQGGHVLRHERRLLRHMNALLSTEEDRTLVRIVRDRGGYHWDLAGADWGLRRVRGLRGRAVLERKGQALAAMQYRGREMDMWTEIVYDSRTYQLEYGEDDGDDFVLEDAGGGTVLVATQVLREHGTPRGTDALITLNRDLPVTLVAITVARILDEAEMKEVIEAD